MVNLSLGLAYVHYGLKRQSTNRQYLLLQGQSFLSRYAELGSPESLKEKRSQWKAEAYYNLGRLYQLLGINYLALEYYTRAVRVLQSSEVNIMRQEGLEVMAVSNKYILLIINRNTTKALNILKGKIKL